MADGARRGRTTAWRRLAHRLATIGTAAFALGASAPTGAGEAVLLSTPRVQDGSELDGQTYSYYYVPRLSELNHLVGYLFRTGLVRKDAPEPAAAIRRYAAYSCEGTLFVGADSEHGSTEDVNWATVTALHAGPAAGPPSLVVEREPPASNAAKPLVLYVPDQTIRYQLHQALAVLVAECRPRPGRDGDPARRRAQN